MTTNISSEHIDVRKTRDIITAVILFGKADVVYQQWTRQAYEDLTSGGTPFIEPATKMSGYFPMNTDQLAEAITFSLSHQNDISDGDLNQLLGSNYRDTMCLGRYSFREKNSRCWNCAGCATYLSGIRSILPGTLSFRIRS